MTRLASMLIPLLVAAAAVIGGAAQAGEYYERVGPDHYRPARGAWYSSTCCYKKIVKHITITRSVWVKVPPPRPHHARVEDDDVVEAPRGASREPVRGRGPRVVELGEVIRRDGQCRKPVPVRDGNTTIIVMINVRCR